jgi:hypothetical protein
MFTLITVLINGNFNKGVVIRPIVAKQMLVITQAPAKMVNGLISSLIIIIC